MSDHAWVLENLASYVAGGLGAEERDQLEEHAAECAGCARALDEARAVDRRLEALFAGARPDPALEDRSIRALRQVPGRPGARGLSRWGKVMLGAAAVTFLTLVGFGMNELMEQGELQPPGATASNNLKQLALGRSYFGVKRNESDEVLGTDWGEAGRSAGEGSHRPKGADDLAAALRTRIDPTATYNEVGLADGSVRSSQLGFSDGTSSTIIFSPDGRKTATGGNGVRLWNDSSASMAFDLAPNGTMDRTKTEKGLPDGSTGAEAPPSVKFPPAPPGKRAGEYFRPGDAFAQGSRQDEGREREKGGEGKSGEDGTPGQKRPEGEAGGRKGPGDDGKEGKGKGEEQKQPQAPVGRKIIRSGEMQFVVDSFDASVATITRLVHATKGGFIATVNSDKLANGKMCGSVVVRVPPDQLDRFILDLRRELGKAGELKGQRIGSKDISKEYTDFESELRGNRAMEERLLKIIKEGKGTVKDLVVAEEALGKYREKIERIEGELRYYANLVALSTLTIDLTEKEIRVAAAVAESERVLAHVEVEDVDRARKDAEAAVRQAQGRIVKSEVKDQAAGQRSAELEFEVPADSAGAVRERLRKLGTVTKLEVSRSQHGEGGVLALKDGKVVYGPTRFSVRLYNLANVEPRETVTLKVAAPDVPAAFYKLREVLAKANAQNREQKLNEKDQQNITAQLDFNVRRPQEAAVRAALEEVGVVLSRDLSRAQASENVTDAKVAYKVEVVPTTQIPPRELITLALVVNDVDATLTLFKAQVKEAHGRAGDPVYTREADGRVTARVIFMVPLAAAQGLFERFKSSGQVRVEQARENAQAPAGKLAVARIDVTLSNTAQLVSADEGLGAQLRRSLSFSLRALYVSAGYLLIGVLFVLPWLLLVLAVVWLVRRLVFRPAEAPPAVPPAAGGTAPAGG